MDPLPPDESSGPTERTRRQEIERLLADGSQSVESLARALGARVVDVENDLSHLLRSRRGKLSVDPATCDQCGFVFRKRDRLTAPSRCPECRSERIDPPRFTLR